MKKSILLLSTLLLCLDCLFAQYESINLSDYEKPKEQEQQENTNPYLAYVGQELVCLSNVSNFYVMSFDEQTRAMNFYTMKQGDLYTITDAKYQDSYTAFKNIVAKPSSITFHKANNEVLTLTKSQLKNFSYFERFTNGLFELKKATSNEKFYISLKYGGNMYYREKLGYMTFMEYVELGYLAELTDFEFTESIEALKNYFEGKIVFNYNNNNRSHNGKYECIKVGLHNGQVSAILKDSATNDVISVPLGGSPRYVNVVNYTNSYYYDSKDSIIASGTLVLYNDLDSIGKLVELRKAEKERLKKLQNEANRKDLVKKYGEKFGNAIAKGEISVGMTKEMCQEAYGYPCEQSKRESSLGQYDVWVYYAYCSTNMIQYGVKYVHFVNGKISQIDTE